MVSHRADVVLRLPKTPAFDARARVQAVDDAPAEEVSGGRRLGRDRLALSGLAEQQPEPWAGRGEARRRCQSQVELESVRQQEHAVDRRAALEIDELHRIELVAQPASPVVENLGNGDAVGDREGEVEIGEAIAAADCERADGGSGNDSSVLLGKRQHALA